MKKILATVLSVFACSGAIAGCPSEATINIESSTYSGAYNIEIRSGTRPGSKIVGTKNLEGNGTAVFSEICAGKYFFAFGIPKSDEVNITQYFDVQNNGDSYSNPVITVFYTRTLAKGHKVGKSKRRDL